MASGVGVSEAAVEAFTNIKMKKGDKPKFVLFRISDDLTEIIVEHSSADENYGEFINKLPVDDCRYALYDFEYTLSDKTSVRQKLCFICWSPDTAPIKSKMLYASSKDALKKRFQGLSCERQATEFDEIEEDEIVKDISNNYTK